MEYKANKVVSSRPDDDDGRHGMDLFIVYIISWQREARALSFFFFLGTSVIFLCVCGCAYVGCDESFFVIKNNMRVDMAA